MRKSARQKPAEDVKDYLSAVPPGARRVLERLRGTIRAAAPEATEVIRYGMPVFKQAGMLVGYGAFSDHCSFFVMSTSVMESHRRELRAYDTSKGTIRFTVDKPLPAALVRKLVKERLRENEARSEARGKAGKSKRSSA